MAKVPQDTFSGGANLTGSGPTSLAELLSKRPEHTDFSAITPIADPATATATDVANKLNEILAVLTDA